MESSGPSAFRAYFSPSRQIAEEPFASRPVFVNNEAKPSLRNNESQMESFGPQQATKKQKLELPFEFHSSFLTVFQMTKIKP